mmetsp:Transcript_153693/g.268818  ORF Transcript_153693/g.268818 Transcript_153693/m.268818 type:complete len:284 (+) Transcript_153693:1856-2707(+)
MPATISGGLPIRRLKGVSMCSRPSCLVRTRRGWYSRPQSGAKRTRLAVPSKRMDFGNSWGLVVPRAPAMMTCTPVPSLLRWVWAPIPPLSPGPKSIICVALMVVHFCQSTGVTRMRRAMSRDSVGEARRTQPSAVERTGRVSVPCRCSPNRVMSVATSATAPCKYVEWNGTADSTKVVANDSTRFEKGTRDWSLLACALSFRSILFKPHRESSGPATTTLRGPLTRAISSCRPAGTSLLTCSTCLRTVGTVSLAMCSMVVGLPSLARRESSRTSGSRADAGYT